MEKDNDKEKVQKLKRSFKLDLPDAPPDPEEAKADDLSPFSRIESYKDREKLFRSNLQEAISKTSRLSPGYSPKNVNYSSTNEDSGLGNKGSDWESDDIDTDLEKECNEFMNPLLNRTSTSVSAALSTKGALDQLDSLHRLVDQFMKLQQQNLQMTRAVKVTNTLCGLKMIQQQVSHGRSNLI